MIFPSKSAFDSLAAELSFLPFIMDLPLGDETPRSLYRRLYAGKKYSFLLESGRGPEKTSRHSFIGGNPHRVFISKGEEIEIIEEDKVQQYVAHPVLELERILNFQRRSFPHLPSHFWGGCVGFAGYDLVHLFEEIPQTAADDLHLSDMVFLFPRELLVVDHAAKALKVIAVSESRDGYEKGGERLRELQKRVEARPVSPPLSVPPSRGKPSPLLRRNMDRKDFEANVRRAKEYIREGDIYQANLSWRLDVEFKEDPFDLYERLFSINPSPFSSFLNLDGFFLVSSSPERLIKVEGKEATTRPIAGTRPRGSDPEEDRNMSKELMLSEKERAEHLMLVDLERNDLGRVCRPGTVVVDEFMELESYSHVWHIISNIKGELKEGVGLEKILAACFPGGTVTGCPKVRCMEIIDELEPTRRGPYTGSIGYIGYDGRIDLNIIIRTIVVKGERAYVQIGAGIVADSIPELEYDETEKKGAAMLEALMGEGWGNKGQG